MNATMTAQQPGPGPDPHSISSGGRLRQTNLDANDRLVAVWIHLSPLFTIVVPPAVVAPLFLWLIRRERSPFVDDHGREVVNLMITALIVTVAGAMIPLLGWLAAAVWCVVAAINLVRGAIAANAGEFFRYPMTIRLIS
jgi:hypothetical protein